MGAALLLSDVSRITYIDGAKVPATIGYMRIFTFILLSFVLLPATLAAQSHKIKVACIGNSVTYGYTLSDPSTQSYPALLQQRLGSGYEVRNFGHSGATLLRKGHRPYDKTPEFREALNLHADIAIIDLGLNDTDPRDWPAYRDDFMRDYRWLIDTLRASNPRMKVYICTLTPVFTGHPRFMSSTLSWYTEVQKLIPVIARQNGATLVDLYGPLHDRPDLFTDPPTLHPNRKGAAKLSDIVYCYLTGDYGGLQLADIFSDNMVLQRGRPVCFWGTANAGTMVKVRFNKQTRSAVTAASGKWKVTFPSMKGGHKTWTAVISDKGKTMTLRNMLVGDVWLCAGQSNMYFPLAQSTGGHVAASRAGRKDLRLFRYVPYAETTAAPWDSAALAKADDLDFFSGTWKRDDSLSASAFSAVGYYFGRRILEKEDVPVGLIELATGGSPLISWLDRRTLETHPLFEPALHDWLHSDYIMGWCRRRAAVNLKDATSPYQRHPYDPCFNFEAGIAKITAFPIKGVIWYQGASDADNPELFSRLFPVFVKDWRRSWGYDFPFYYVQLSSLDRPSWNHFRDAQRRLLKVIRAPAGMAVTIDLGDSTNVHYPDKKPVGLRLADLALNRTYHEKQIVATGPAVEEAKKRGDSIVVSFGSAAGLTTSDSRPLRGFELIDEEGDFLPVHAVIRGNQVRMAVPSGKVISRVVYGWKPFTRANLVNGAKRPAPTFMMKLD